MIAERPIAAIEQVDGLQGALSGKEAALGNPASDGMVLASTTAGVRSWVPSGGQIIHDVTLNAPWKSGTATIDPATGTITLAGHGFSANMPIEFDAGTGALPSGIGAYDSDNLGGTYYNVINVSGGTFQVTGTVGGSTPVVPSDAGTSGWRVRPAYPFTSAYSQTGFNLAVGETLTFVLNGEGVKITTGATSFAIGPLTSISAGDMVKTNSLSAWPYLWPVWNMSSQKYSKHFIRFEIRRLATALYALRCESFSIGTDNKSSVTTHQMYTVNGAVLVKEVSTLGYTLIWNVSNAGLFRNGLRIVGWRS